jgi:hypothetical protein
MGIRCYCPNGHKLNIKAFQAGLRGICPRCGESFVIPRHSTRRSTKHRSDSVVGSNEMAAGGEGFSASAGSAVAVPDQDVEISLHTVEEAPSASAANASSPPSPSSTDDLSRPEDRIVDPIDENPRAIWYVRPPIGGQYGPADGEVMRSWIAEGRISVNSLVWREGWEQWEEAMKVFPQLSPRPSSREPEPPGGIPSIGVVARPRKKSVGSASRIRAIDAPPSEEGSSWVWIVACVVLAGLIGAGLLVYWFLRF